MTSTETPQTKTWAKAIAQPAQEFSHTSLSILAGKVPEGLRGTLYRNGSARLERGDMLMGHWFDGDGAILAVHFTDAGATGVYRYVKTSGYQEEAAANKLLYGNYGMTAPGLIWNKWLKPIKNVANTSVIAIPDRILALWEGGQPYALELATLETKGIDDLGALNTTLPYSAHPKRDYHTGEIFNFGVSPGLNAKLNIYKSDFTGKIIQTAEITLAGVPLIHDFVLAGQYLIFCIPLVRLNLLPVLTGLSSFSDSLTWQPSQGTQILVIDRETLTLVSRGEAEPWYQWHFANGYVDKDGTAIVEMVRYEDFQTNQNLQEVATGKIKTPAASALWQLHLNPITGKVIKIQPVLNRVCEFPIVPQEQVGRTSRYTYLAVHREGVDGSADIFSAIARFDNHTASLTVADLGENCYPSEPIYVPDAINSKQGWVITVIYDGNSDKSEVWIFDSDSLDDAPVCKLGLPSVIPHSFHGTWSA